MVPAGVVDASIKDLAPKLESGDILIDGGNSYYIDDIRRAKELQPKGIHYVDVGRGYQWRRVGTRTRLLPNDWWRKRLFVVKRLDPIFKTLAPGRGFDRSHAGPGKKRRARPKTVICTAGQTAPATL